jgi:anti-anti-sigma regulatory factor
MTDLQRIAEPVIVFLPDEIDMNNAGSVYHQLCSVCAPGVAVLADLTSTRFCDSSGIRQIALAHHHAASLGTQLRLAVAPAAFAGCSRRWGSSTCWCCTRLLLRPRPPIVSRDRRAGRAQAAARPGWRYGTRAQARMAPPCLTLPVPGSPAASPACAV